VLPTERHSLACFIITSRSGASRFGASERLDLCRFSRWL